MSAHRVGLYLAVIQFFFALSWTVYVIFLPQLAAQVGIPRHAVIYVLMLDQLIFVLADYAMGVASNRAVRVVGRLGRVVLAVTLLSCAAFLALPLVAPSGSTPLFLGIVVVWSLTSSALRAPPLTLVGRHAARPQVPWLVGLSVLGLGVASAIAPYLSVVLRDLDPRGPFLLSSVALALATWGIVAAERALAGQHAPASGREPPAGPGSGTPAALGFLIAAALAAAAFQLHTFINSTPLYLRFAKPAELQWLLPVFWIGFNLAMLPASWATSRFGGWQVMGAAGLAAALASLWAHQATGLQPLIAAQLVAGAAWAGLLMSAFSVALALGHTGREGHFGGALSSVLALGRVAVLALALALEWQKGPGEQAALAWAPVAGWLLAGGVLFLLARRRQA